MNGQVVHHRALRQYEAARLLLDAWFRAVHRAVAGTYGVLSATWLDERTTRRSGAAIRVVATIASPIPDRALTYVDPPVHALVTPTLDETEDAPEWVPEEPEPDSD